MQNSAKYRINRCNINKAQSQVKPSQAKLNVIQTERNETKSIHIDRILYKHDLADNVRDFFWYVQSPSIKNLFDSI